MDIYFFLAIIAFAFLVAIKIDSLKKKKNTYIEDGEKVHQACREGNKEIIDSFVQGNYDMDSFVIGHETPLFDACRYGHMEIVKTLVESGCKIDISGVLSETPLYEACIMGHLDIVKFLFEKGADINFGTKNGKPPILAAYCSGREDTIEFLFEKGVDINLRNSYDQSLIEIFRPELKDLTMLLFERGAQIDKETEQPFLIYLLNSKQRYLLLCARKFCPDSAFGEERLPMDLFKVILFLSNLVTRDPFRLIKDIPP